MDTFVDLCDFLFDSYKNTPRDALLALMAKAADIDRLRTLDQRDLAIAYSERMASAFRAQAAGGPAHANDSKA